MGKMKIALALFALACALVITASLPWIVTGVMDWSRIGSRGYADIQPVKLMFGTDEVNIGPQYMLDRLKLEASMSSVAIEESDAVMTRQEVVTAALEKMDEYADAGIFTWFDYGEAYATPYLGIDPDRPEQYFVFWTVSMVQEKEPYRSLFLHVDDRSGTILSIRYECYGPYDQDAAKKKSPQIMEKLTNIFFGQLGLDESLLANGESEVGTDRGELDGGVLFARYRIPTETMEDVYVDFYVIGTGGFSTYFPTEDVVQSQGW